MLPVRGLQFLFHIFDVFASDPNLLCHRHLATQRQSISEVSPHLVFLKRPKTDLASAVGKEKVLKRLKIMTEQTATAACIWCFDSHFIIFKFVQGFLPAAALAHVNTKTVRCCQPGPHISPC